MATPSFEKRMRRHIGETVTFVPTGRVKPITVRISAVEWNAKQERYVLVGRDVTNIAKKGSPTVRYFTDRIERPVSYTS